MLQRIKSYMMPLAMLTGGLFYKYTSLLSFSTPYLIGIMLFITYCNLSFSEIRLSRLHLWLLAIQIIGSIAIFLVLAPLNIIVAQGVMICIFAPTATSAPVITKILGGDMASLTTYSLLSNMAVAVLAPILFSFVGNIDASSFIHSVILIFKNIGVLLFLPFLLALLLKKILPRVHYQVKRANSISFYLWSVALVVTTGKIILFITEQDNPNYIVEISIAILSLVVCVSQFLVGRKIGNAYDNTIAGGQGLGQKNTILAIWMAQTYLNPISSIGPGAYVLWQNIVNSYQVWRIRKSL